MNFNPNIHHRRSIRLKGYDYSQQGLYFITLCVQNRVCLFGEIENGIMVLNAFGKIAHHEWMQTAAIRKNVSLHAFVVMPNHFHAIIEICPGGRGELHSPELDTPEIRSSQLRSSQLDLPEIRLPEFDSPPQSVGEFNSPLRGPSGTVGAIVRGYKSAVTKQLKTMCFDGVLWQRNYWERIIRDEGEYERITTYIENNPMNWNNDTLRQ